MIVVLGMRSGTSLIAGILHSAGINMGKNFQGPTPFNRRGYFENLDFLNYSVGLHSTLGRDRFKDPIKRKDLDKVPYDKLAELKELIRTSKRDFWGIKVPSSVYWLPLIELFEEPKYVLCVRDRTEMAQSLNKYGHDVAKDHNWFDYVDTYWDTAERYTNNKPKFYIDYHSVLEYPLHNLRKLFIFLGYSVSEEQLEQLCESVRPELNHETPLVDGKPMYSPVDIKPRFPKMTVGFEEEDR